MEELANVMQQQQQQQEQQEKQTISSERLDQQFLQQEILMQLSKLLETLLQESAEGNSRIISFILDTVSN